MEANEDRSPLSTWVVKRLICFRNAAGLDVHAIAKETKLSLGGVKKIESPHSNPTVESLDLYVKACGKTLGEFFEPLIPPDNPRYDRYIHRIVQAALQHPIAKPYLRSLIGLISKVMEARTD